MRTINRLLPSHMEAIQIAYRLALLVSQPYWITANPSGLAKMYYLCHDQLYSLQRDVELLKDHNIYPPVREPQESCAWPRLIEEEV